MPVAGRRPRSALAVERQVSRQRASPRRSVRLWAGRPPTHCPAAGRPGDARAEQAPIASAGVRRRWAPTPAGHPPWYPAGRGCLCAAPRRRRRARSRGRPPVTPKPGPAAACLPLRRASAHRFRPSRMRPRPRQSLACWPLPRRRKSGLACRRAPRPIVGGRPLRRFRNEPARARLLAQQQRRSPKCPPMPAAPPPPPRRRPLRPRPRPWP